MKTATKTAKTLTLDTSTVEYVTATKGESSTSERVNELLRRAIVQEQYERLEREAAEFFATAPEQDREEAKAFQSATVRTLARD